MLQPSVVQAATALTTLLCGLALIRTTRWHGRVSLDSTEGLQKFHVAPTPRIGGLATLAGLVAGHGVAPEPVRQLLGPLLIASLPAFCAGLMEDLTKKVGVAERLTAAIFSGFLAWYLTGLALTRTGVPGLDDLLAFTPVSVLFTAVAIGGMTNAVNIIDGFNGLAGGVVSIIFVAFGAIAAGAGDTALAGTCWTLAACSIAFTLVNWPFGRIFLGDGGAYQFGFAVGWLAVLLLARHPEIPAWAPLMVCAYPVLEVAFSIVRKTRRAGYHPGLPDRVHLHMLVHRRVVRQWLSARSGIWQNALTSPFAWLYAALLATWGVTFAHHSGYLIAGLVGAALAYAGVYTRLASFRWWPFGRSRRHADHAPARPSQPRPGGGGLALALPLERRPLYLGFPVGHGGAFTAFGGPAVRPTEPLHADRFAILAYGILGLSTCVTIIEPAPFELLALPLILASWARHVLSRSRPYTQFSAALVLLLALFSLLQLLPVSAALHVQQAAGYAGVTAMLIVIAIHLGRLFGTGDPRFNAFARGYCVAALVSAAVAIASLALAAGGSGPEWLFTAGRPRAFFKDPNVLGPYLVPAVLAFLHQATQGRSLRALGLVACALLCALGVVATMSRGAWVNLAIALAVYTLLGRTRATIVVLVIAVASLLLALAAGSGALSASAPDLLELFAERTQLQGYDADRFRTTREAWELGLRYPLGVGPGVITSYTGFDAMAPHNTYARIWAENGPAALILFLFIVGAASVAAFQAWWRSTGSASGVMAAAIALLMGMLVNAAVIDALHWRHFWLLMCLCIFCSHGRRSSAGWRAR